MLSDEAHKAASKQTIEKLKPMLDAMAKVVTEDRELSKSEIEHLLSTGRMWITIIKRVLMYYKNTGEKDFLKSAELYIINAEKIYKKIKNGGG